MLPYPKTNTSFLTDDDYKRCIERGYYYSIPDIVKTLHFNPLHPENHNIYIPNIRNDNVMIYNEYNDWIQIDKCEILTILIQDNDNLLQSWVKQHHDDLTDRQKRKFKLYNDQLINKGRFIHERSEDLTKVLYDNKHISIYTQKTIQNK